MLCVITRFRLRRPWHLIRMFWLYLSLRRELTTVPGLLRSAFLIEGPFVCCTLSLWSSEDGFFHLSNLPSHIHAVRNAKAMCAEIWSAFWRLEHISPYASSWDGALRPSGAHGASPWLPVWGSSHRAVPSPEMKKEPQVE